MTRRPRRTNLLFVGAEKRPSELLAVYTYVCLSDTIDPRGGKGK